MKHLPETGIETARPTPVGKPAEYLLALGALALLSLCNALLTPLIGYWSVGFLFLLGIMGLACLLSLGPALLAAALSALSWNLFFIPPVYDLSIRSLADYLMCLTYLVVALLVTGLTRRIRDQEAKVRLREARLEVLYRFSRRLAEAGSRPDLEALAEEEIARPFLARVRLGTGHEALRGPLTLPLRTPAGSYGRLELARPLDHEQSDLLETLGRQLALALERQALHESANQVELLRLSEALYDGLLDSVSHELRTPLTAIQCAIANLQNARILSRDDQRLALLADLEEASLRMSHLVANLLDMSRLQSGRLNLDLSWWDPADIVRAALKALEPERSDRALALSFAADLPLIRADFGLLEQAIINLLHNAFHHTPPAAPIRIEIAAEGGQLAIRVLDRGQGLPPESLARLFEKFYRVPGTQAQGTGMGLSIARGFVEAHGGRLTAANRPDGGAAFTIMLPIHELPAVPHEDEAPHEEDDVTTHSGH